jgi:hypothetical protein
MMANSHFFKDDFGFRTKSIDGFFEDLCTEKIIDQTEIVGDDEIDIDFEDMCDGYYINAEVIPSVDNSLLYCSMVVPETQTLLTGNVDFKKCDVSPMSHVAGLRLTYLAEDLQKIYHEMVDVEKKSIYELTPEAISDKLGGIRYYDYFKEPYSGFAKESATSSSFKNVCEALYDITPKAKRRYLSIGGDKGGASRRKRSYHIDCVYFVDDEEYRESVKVRKARGIAGFDYLYGVDFTFKTRDPNEWDVITFNYYFFPNLTKSIREWASNSSVLVYARGVDPDWTDSDIALSRKIIPELTVEHIDESLASKYGYQIPGFADEACTRVHVYTTHGFFIDSVLVVPDGYYKIPTIEMIECFSNSPPSLSDRHSSYLVLSNGFDLNINMLYTSPIPTLQDFYDNQVFFSVKERVIYDQNGVEFMSHVDLPDTSIQVVNLSKDRFSTFVDQGSLNGYIISDVNHVFLDINIQDMTYAMRRFYMKSKGLRLFTGSGISFHRVKSFYDGPSEWSSLYLDFKDKYNTYLNSFESQLVDNSGSSFYDGQKKIDVKTREGLRSKHINDILKIPDIILEGISYNPYVRRWVTGGYSHLLKGEHFANFVQKFKNSNGFYAGVGLVLKRCLKHVDEEVVSIVDQNCYACKFGVTVLNKMDSDQLFIRGDLNFKFPAYYFPGSN